VQSLEFRVRAPEERVATEGSRVRGRAVEFAKIEVRGLPLRKSKPETSSDIIRFVSLVTIIARSRELPLTRLAAASHPLPERRAADYVLRQSSGRGEFDLHPRFEG
jgi:hypothetical protein